MKIVSLIILCLFAFGLGFFVARVRDALKRLEEIEEEEGIIVNDDIK